MFFHPLRLIKRIIYAVLFLAVVFGVINYQALMKQAEYYFYSKYPKAEVIRTILEKPSREEGIPAETRLIIPKINVNVPVIEVENSQESTIQKGLENGVVHYPGTANSGEVGNYFILGHSSDYIWRKGDYKDIFALLGKLETNDEIKVYYQGKEYLYRVIDKIIVSENEVQVLASTPEPTISLMTCWPVGTPLKRLIVKGKLIEN